ncbi:DUF1593 domain-containing protein [Allopontixanthobacter sediminis]|uniref:DUF1593 domain-containing protein n=1 Tax=Allopontixanthobacter sediminis TaxID=1689985 RepID=A0A845BAF1_9SPHN|nr:nucleoside hydrolase-like domain-containing protein [Allopontixanthobacter sediminis]MXP44569.1 DUF1593 domain-containing protein [Allopontixanthobacter sediminis]
MNVPLRKMIAVVSLPLALLGMPVLAQSSGAQSRVFVLTDIEADPDDTQSLIRLLLYANEIDVEGMVATTSVHKRTSVSPESLHQVLQHYASVLPNLRQHDPHYPAVEELVATISAAQPVYGMGGVGPRMDSQGSAALLRQIEREDDRPLWIAVWGGANTLAQALYRLRERHSPEVLADIVARLRVYAISDQDDAGPWVRKNFPKLFYIVSPGDNYAASTWIGINSVIGGIDNTTISNRWLAENIQQGHGPLGAAYPDVAWGMEGDTPTFLSLIPNGLNVPDRPDWGGWGGRYELRLPPSLPADTANAGGGLNFHPETRPIWTDTYDAYGPPKRPEFNRSITRGEVVDTSAKATVWRWRDAFQNDFAARMDWTVLPYGEANHPPVVKVKPAEGPTVRSGEGIWVSARGTTDPDGDSLTYFWFHYPEAGTYRGSVSVGTENADGVWIIAPEVTQEETIHIILAVTDKGAPPLTRYARVIVKVKP